MKKKILCLGLVLMMMLSFVGCSGGETLSGQTDSSSDEQKEDPVTYEAMMYDNQGNNFLNFYGKEFDISPNKVKRWGYNSDGSWESWYEESSVVTIEVDGKNIQSCGSTVIFKDSRLEMLEIPSELNTTNSEVSEDNASENGISVNNNGLKTYFGLTTWWYDMKEKGQHGKKVVLIQSQNGYNIGAFAGNDVTWKVAKKLPKTTQIMIDGKSLYIHRCNFTIIDSDLLEN